ncbi:MAG: dephospho-CoA kinase [Treponema sp.]|nr:dephospho-CoA kinase [Treponema sp.]
MIIGLTGTYCSGKNHIAALLEARGYPVLDVDKLGYQALETEKEAILAQFGEGCLTPENGALDRRKLGQIVFGNSEKLTALEAIIHPVANRMTEEWIAGQNKPCVVNAALLHRSAVFKRLNRLILVKAPFVTRLIRAKRRDRLSLRETLKRMASQKDFNAQYLSINAEIYIVENSGLHIKPDPSCSREINWSKKLENRIDMFIKGIN